MQQVEDAKDTESWTVDQSDGTMYFFLDENNGWRLVITDAAARAYLKSYPQSGGSASARVRCGYQTLSLSDSCFSLLFLAFSFFFRFYSSMYDVF